MKLWLLRPIELIKNSPWVPSYNKVHGFVIRAESEEKAREIAQKNSGEESGEWSIDENGSEVEYNPEVIKPWLNKDQSICIELLLEGLEGVIIRDYEKA